jgi:hypothetical protein
MQLTCTQCVTKLASRCCTELEAAVTVACRSTASNQLLPRHGTHLPHCPAPQDCATYLSMLPDPGQMHISLARADTLIRQLPGVLGAVSVNQAAVLGGSSGQGIMLSREAGVWATSAALFSDINSTLADLRARIAALPGVE